MAPAASALTFIDLRSEAILLGSLFLLGLSAAGALYTWVLHRTLRRRTDQLHSTLQRLRSAITVKDEFLAKVTHELKTPLHGITGLHELLLASMLSPAQRHQLELAQAAAQRLDRLVGSLLDLCDADTGRLPIRAEEFDPAATATGLVEAYLPAAQAKGLELRAEFDSLPARLTGDRRRVRQILEALVDNAIQFTSRGHVLVRGEATQRDGVVELSFLVEDTGPGIPSSFRDHLFEPFRQADGSLRRRHGGSGVSLAVAARLAAVMSGRLWLDTSAAGGCSFRFTIPCGIPAPAPPPRPLRVLLAEDNALNQLLARRPLERAGHEVVIAEDGRAAVRLYESQTFDLILMDVQMPVMDGLQATRLIREQERPSGRRVPIAAVTAHSLSEDLERYRAAGIDDLLAKPFHTSDLLCLIRRLLDHKPAPPVVQ